MHACLLTILFDIQPAWSHQTEWCDGVIHIEVAWNVCNSDIRMAADSTQAPQQTQADVQNSRSLVLPDVPNVWEQMLPTADGMLSTPEEVQYMHGEDDNLANDAMLLIMHAVQARSQGRSLTEERRVSAEQYWRQAEEQGEAALFRASADGDSAHAVQNDVTSEHFS